MLVEHITPMLITFNEEANLRRVLAKLTWARRIVVVDSGSTDATLRIAGEHPQVDIVNRSFDSFAEQCNFGLTVVSSEWVLSMDSDYELSDSFISEIHKLENLPDVAGYVARFEYRIYGRALRASLYPPRVILYRTKIGRYRNEGHGHRVALEGKIRPLQSVIYHDDRKPLSRWLQSQLQYAAKEAEHILTAPKHELSSFDRVRKAGWPAPILTFFYVLAAKRAMLDGWPGWFYALQRLVAEALIALQIADRRLRKAAE